MRDPYSTVLAYIYHNADMVSDTGIRGGLEKEVTDLNLLPFYRVRISPLFGGVESDLRDDSRSSVRIGKHPCDVTAAVKTVIPRGTRALTSGNSNYLRNAPAAVPSDSC